MARRSTWRTSAATVALAIGLAGAMAMPAFADFDDGMAAYEAGNHERAMELWRPLAEAGDAAAQYWVGRLFERGEGVPVSLARAAMWYRLAADQEEAQAQAALDDVLATLRDREAGQSGPQPAGQPQVADARPGATDDAGSGTDAPGVPRYAPDRDPGLDPGAAPDREAGVGAPGSVPGRDGAPADSVDGVADAARPPALPPLIDGAEPDAVPGEDGVEAAGVAETDDGLAPGIEDGIAEGAGYDVDAGVETGVETDVAAYDAAVDGGVDPIADADVVDDPLAESVPGVDADVAALDDDVLDEAVGVDGDGYGPDDIEGDGIDDAAVAEGDVVGIDEDVVGIDEDVVELAALEDDLVVEELAEVAELPEEVLAEDAVEDALVEDGAVDGMPGLDALPPELAEAMADGALDADEIAGLVEDGVVTPDMIDDLVDAGLLDADSLAELAEAGVLDDAALDALVDNDLLDEALVADARGALEDEATVTADGGSLLDDIVDGVTSIVGGGGDAAVAAAPPRRLITERQ